MNSLQQERLEDYGFIGDCQSIALVSSAGSIDWLCVPRMDSAAMFAKLLGAEEHGYWSLRPVSACSSPVRRYLEDTLILETSYECAEGSARVLDFMPVRDRYPDLVRMVIGEKGHVDMQMCMRPRFDYGAVEPWITRIEDGCICIAGANAVRLRSDVPIRVEDGEVRSSFRIEAGQRNSFCLRWFPSYQQPPPPIDAQSSLESTEAWWRDWIGNCCYEGSFERQVRRSLITIKSLIYAPTGGIIAAPTTSLPERIGGKRNWDYRFCWLRDASLSLFMLLRLGFTKEAEEWKRWLLRAVAGSPEQLQPIYGIAGERRLSESDLDWLPGYQDSQPVRVGNAAYSQLQVDVFGEVVNAMHQSRRAGLNSSEEEWAVERALIEHLEKIWQEPDNGIWEVRGPRRHFTHSKVLAWVAFDRGIKAIEKYGHAGPVERWRKTREAVFKDVQERGYSAEKGSYVQFYGSQRPDASLLLLPREGFISARDERFARTLSTIRDELSEEGFVRRYHCDPEIEDLPPGEATFLPCSFWMVDALMLANKRSEAQQLFERLLSLQSDLGLYAEEYDPIEKRLLGNYPQAFTHVSFLHSALNVEAPDEESASKELSEREHD